MRSAPGLLSRRPSVILLCAISLLAGLAGCQQVPSGMPAVTVSAASVSCSGPAQGEGILYRVNPQLSTARIYVYAGGSLAGLGHNHLIRVGEIQGWAQIGANDSEPALSLEIPVDAFELDNAELRAEEGEAFNTPLSAEAIAATRENMLGPEVLDAANHPLICIASESLSGPDWQPDIALRISIRGVSHSYRVPVALALDSERLVATGELTLRQSDFDIEPFSILGGALAVQDQIRIKFRITAEAQPG